MISIFIVLLSYVFWNHFVSRRVAIWRKDVQPCAQKLREISISKFANCLRLVVGLCINYTWKGRASSLATKCSLMLVVRHKTTFGWNWALIICQCFHVKPAQIECWNTQANQALCWGPVLNHNASQLMQKETFEEDFHWQISTDQWLN